VAVVLIGANDATSAAQPRGVGRTSGAAVRRLREAGVQVVVGTCPDLGAVRSVAPPLRQSPAARPADGEAQAKAVTEAGGVVVDLGEETGAVFRADAGTLCYDGFHPRRTVTGCGRTRCTRRWRSRAEPPRGVINTALPP
jgi:hypothetical protein